MQEQNIQNRNRFANSNRWTGLLFLVVGGVLLMKQTGYPFPAWLFTWPVILILFGLFMGVRHRFRDLSWLVMVTIGLVFLSDDIWPGVHLKQYAIPIIIIMLGVLFIFSPRRMCGGSGRFRRHMANRPGFQQPEMSNELVAKEVDATQDTALDVVSIFAGVKKRVLSKQFTGGDIVCVFGGAEINLTNADFISPVVLDLTMVFGGTKLIVPANWELRSEIAAIFGGVDDKRPQPAVGIPEKTIILKGTLMFGGVEVNSFQL